MPRLAYTIRTSACTSRSQQHLNAARNPVGRSSRISASRSSSHRRAFWTRRPSSRHPSRPSHLVSPRSMRRASIRRPSSPYTMDRPAPSAWSRSVAWPSSPRMMQRRSSPRRSTRTRLSRSRQRSRRRRQQRRRSAPSPPVPRFPRP